MWADSGIYGPVAFMGQHMLDRPEGQHDEATAGRDEWIAADVFAALNEESLSGYDKVIGLDLSDLAVDGSLQKSPCGGEGTGKNPTDRAKLGWKWSILTDRNGIPLAWAIDGANRNESVVLEPTLTMQGVLADIETIGLDRGYDWPPGFSTMPSSPRNARRVRPKERIPNTWLAAFGQLRRNTDRKIIHFLAQLALAVTFMLTAKLIDYRNRWSRVLAPIR
jgi:hypothetical protein